MGKNSEIEINRCRFRWDMVEASATMVTGWETIAAATPDLDPSWTRSAMEMQRRFDDKWWYIWWFHEEAVKLVIPWER